MVDVRVEAWRVHDTGLVAVPSRFRRLGGLVRHLPGQGAAGPGAVTLWLSDDALQVTGAAGLVGAWPLSDVRVTPVALGPPVSFVLEVPGGAHLLAAPADATTESLLAHLS